MSKDPAFLFYPGDYLKDTQNLSEKVQVAYDRIMCEMIRYICTDMNNICISYEQHKFFTKRLSDDEKAELDFVLKKTPSGIQIEWVAEKMAERKSYTESRSKNRSSKTNKKDKNISSTYVNHMVNGDEIENRIENKDRIEGVEEREGIIYPYESETFKANWMAWRTMLRDKHDKDYFNREAEQVALMHLSKISKSEDHAIQTIQKALRNGWADLYTLKIENNGNTNNGLNHSELDELIAREAEKLRSNPGVKI